MRKNEKKTTAIRFDSGLQQLRRDAAGMDIGAREIWVDVGVENDSEPVRRFETFTADLNRMAEWLSKSAVGPLGPGFAFCFDENNSRYVRYRRAMETQESRRFEPITTRGSLPG